MKLLVVTQVVDTEDPVLGFFVRWVEELAKHVESVEVICLREGKHMLPVNVHVHSLGKEHEQSMRENTTIYGSASRRGRYGWRFLSLVWKLRHDYDTVFVHMNQEYVLIGGWLWKLLGKRVYLWRNHYAGSLQTDIAAAFCAKVFCTSKHSYTAKYQKTTLMPVGVDTERFSPDARVERKAHSILFLARMSPSKRPEMLLDALATLARNGTAFTASFVGSPLPRDEAYYEELKEKAHALADKITFLPGIPNSQTPDLYRAHEIFINTSPSGMLDKTIFEAAASGCLVLASSKDFAEIAGEDSYFDSNAVLAERLTQALAHSTTQPLSALIEKNSLAALVDSLNREMQV